MDRTGDRFRDLATSPSGRAPSCHMPHFLQRNKNMLLLRADKPAEHMNFELQAVLILLCYIPDFVNKTMYSHMETVDARR